MLIYHKPKAKHVVQEDGGGKEEEGEKDGGVWGEGAG